MAWIAWALVPLVGVGGFILGRWIEVRSAESRLSAAKLVLEAATTLIDQNQKDRELVQQIDRLEEAVKATAQHQSERWEKLTRALPILIRDAGRERSLEEEISLKPSPMPEVTPFPRRSPTR